MNTRTWIGCLSLAAVLASGCASNPRLPEEPVDRGPNPGGEVAKQCAGGAIGMLKMGLVGIPFSAGILVVCMPLAAATAVIHEVVPPWVNDGSGAPNFAYPSTSYFGGCPDGRCGMGSHVPEHRGWSYSYPNSYWGHYRR